MTKYDPEDTFLPHTNMYALYVKTLLGWVLGFRSHDYQEVLQMRSDYADLGHGETRVYQYSLHSQRDV